MLTFRRRGFCRGSPLALTIESASTLGDRIRATSGQFAGARGSRGRNRGFVERKLEHGPTTTEVRAYESLGPMGQLANAQNDTIKFRMCGD